MRQAPDPDWNDLRAFLALSRAESLAGAARALGTRHSTVSRRLDALEQALGVRLVQRTSTGAYLTEAGHRLLPLAQQADRAMAAFAATARGVPSTWRLSLPTGIAALISADLAALLRRRPDLAVEISSSSQTADIEHGQADIALRVGPLEQSDLKAQRVADAGWLLYASQGYVAAHPFTGDLAGHALIGEHADLAASPAGRWMAEHGSAGRMVLRLAQMTDLVAAVPDGLGIGLLPCLLGDRAEGLVRLTPQVLVRQPMMLVFRSDVGEDPRARLLIRSLSGALRRLSKALLGELHDP